MATVKEVGEIMSSCDDIIDEMSMVRAGMHSRVLIGRFVLETRICYD